MCHLGLGTSFHGRLGSWLSGFLIDRRAQEVKLLSLSSLEAGFQGTKS